MPSDACFFCSFCAKWNWKNTKEVILDVTSKITSFVFGGSPGKVAAQSDTVTFLAAAETPRASSKICFVSQCCNLCHLCRLSFLWKFVFATMSWPPPGSSIPPLELASHTGHARPSSLATTILNSSAKKVSLLRNSKLLWPARKAAHAPCGRWSQTRQWTESVEWNGLCRATKCFKTSLV